MILVSDTSPLTNLAAVHQLSLLEQMFGRVFIPEAVAHELKRVSESRVGYVPVDETPWICVRPISDPHGEAVRVLTNTLDIGEAEAIVLAAELNADLLLIDERAGHRAAQEAGVQAVGLLGILIQAKRRGMLPRVGPVLDELIEAAGFWIESHLYTRVLREAGE